MGVDLKLENQNGTMATFRNVAEIAIPKADGSGDQVFGLGGAAYTHISRTLKIENGVTFTTSRPSTGADVDATQNCTASITIPAGCEVLAVRGVRGINGYAHFPTSGYSSGTGIGVGSQVSYSNLFTEDGGDDGTAVTITDNADGTKTVTAAYAIDHSSFGYTWLYNAFENSPATYGSLKPWIELIVIYYEI